MTQGLGRPPRIAFVLLSGSDPVAPQLIAGLNAGGEVEAKGFAMPPRCDSLAEAMAWADDPQRDAIWFESCRPSFRKLLAETDLGGRRVIMRVHQMATSGGQDAADTSWHRVDDAIVDGPDMRNRLVTAAPALPAATRLHVIPGGIDLGRYRPAEAPDPFLIGWCGDLTPHRNPNLALEILSAARGGSALPASRRRQAGRHRRAGQLRSPGSAHGTLRRGGGRAGPEPAAAGDGADRA